MDLSIDIASELDIPLVDDIPCEKWFSAYTILDHRHFFFSLEV